MVKIFKHRQPSSTKSSNNTSTTKTLNLTINTLDINGVGLCKSDTKRKVKPIFVEFALPNEQISAKVIEEKSKYIRAKLVEVKKPSESRVKPKCKHFYVCGGCDLQHLDEQEQLKFKQQKVSQLLAREIGRECVSQLPWQSPITGEYWQYRRKARIGVQYNKQGQPIVGFRQKQSNQLVTVKECSILPCDDKQLFQALNEVLAKLTTKRSVGHIELIVTDKVNLAVRQLAKLNDEDKQIWLNAAADYGWRIFIDNGDVIAPLTNEISNQLSYPLTTDKGELTINFLPQHFVQVNAVINERMVKQAVDWLAVNENDQVFDLFCGLGNFSLALAQHAKQVVGVEGVSEMTEFASQNAQKNNLSNCQFFHADLNADWQTQDFAQHNFTKILLDPARAGAYQACQQIIKFNAEKVLYVSCDPTSLAKDTALLLANNYCIKKIALIDMFSQTKHVETMVLFERV